MAGQCQFGILRAPGHAFHSARPSKTRSRLRRGISLMKLELSRAQKALLAWSIIFLILAEVVKLLHIEGKAATRIGLVEVVVAMLTGIAFGITASTRKNDEV